MATERLAEGLERGAEGEAETARGGDEREVGWGCIRLVVHPALQPAAQGGGVRAQVLQYLLAERLRRIAQHLCHGLH